MRQNFLGQFIQVLKHWLCSVWLGVVAELGPLCCPVLAQLFEFSVHLIGLLSIRLLGNSLLAFGKL